MSNDDVFRCCFCGYVLCDSEATHGTSCPKCGTVPGEGSNDTIHGEDMCVFEIGHFYRHPGGEDISVVGIVDTTMYGRALVAESNINPDLKPIGMDASCRENWSEISEQEWMNNFETSCGTDSSGSKDVGSFGLLPTHFEIKDLDDKRIITRGSETTGGSQIQIKCGGVWKFVNFSDVKEGDIVRESIGGTEWIAKSLAYQKGGNWELRVDACTSYLEYKVKVHYRGDGKWEAVFEKNGGDFSGEGDTERSALANLLWRLGVWMKT